MQRLMLILGAVLILLSGVMISCGEVETLPVRGLITPTDEIEKIIPTVRAETATPVSLPTDTPASPQDPMPVLLWQVQTSAIPEGAIWFSPAGVFFTMTLTEVGLSPSDKYSIAAFDSQTGEQKWIKEGTYVPSYLVGPKLPTLHAIGPELILIGNQAFDAETGNLKWEIPSSIPLDGGWVSFPHQVVMLSQTAQDSVYLSDNPNGNLVALDINTGEMKWARIRDEQGNLVNYHNLILVEDTLYGVQGESIEALDRFTGELKWSYRPERSYPWPFNFPFPSVTANERGVFGLRGLSPLIVFHLDPLGKLQWEKEIETNLGVTMNKSVYLYLRSIKGVLIITVIENAPYGPVHFYGVGEATGKFLWSNIENPPEQMPLVYSKVGNSIVGYGLSQDATSLNVIDLATDENLGSYQLPGKAETTTFSDGVLYVFIKTDEAHSILALKLPE